MFVQPNDTVVTLGLLVVVNSVQIREEHLVFIFTYVIYKDANIMVVSVDKTTLVVCPSHHHMTLLGDLDSLTGWTGWAAASPAKQELSVARLLL